MTQEKLETQNQLSSLNHDLETLRSNSEQLNQEKWELSQANTDLQQRLQQTVALARMQVNTAALKLNINFSLKLCSYLELNVDIFNVAFAFEVNFFQEKNFRLKGIRTGSRRSCRGCCFSWRRRGR